MEDEVIKALESLYSQGKTEDEIVAASIEAGYEDQVDKVKEFFKKKKFYRTGSYTFRIWRWSFTIRYERSRI